MEDLWDRTPKPLMIRYRILPEVVALILPTPKDRRIPFPIRAVQVDSCSEFARKFEQACQQRGLRLFVLPPRSPKLNGAAERAQRTHCEEFYQVLPCSPELKALNRELASGNTSTTRRVRARP